MIPAFPMDGGRVLRATLAGITDYVTATQISVAVGKGAAVLFGLAGFFFLSNPFLIVIAFFIYLAAAGEAKMVEIRSTLEGITVGDAMMTRYQSLSPADSLELASRELLAGSQQDFPVVDDGRFLGMLRRSDLVRALETNAATVPVWEVITLDCPTARAEDPLDRLVIATGHYLGTIPVLDGGRLIGLLDSDNVGELLMLHSVLGTNRRTPIHEEVAA
jgi:CBS domain-containing protein